MTLQLRHLWVISSSGLRLFSLNFLQEDIDDIIEEILFEDEGEFSEFKTAGNVSIVLNYITECILGTPIRCFETDNLLWAIDPPTRTPSACRVVALAKLDPGLPIGSQKRRLMTFCEALFMDFLETFGAKLDLSLQSGDLYFEDYRGRCIALANSHKFPLPPILMEESTPT